MHSSPGAIVSFPGANMLAITGLNVVKIERYPVIGAV